MQSKDHWQHVYSTKATDTVSWFQPHADTSLRLIEATCLSNEASIIDVGGGASTLVDDLLAMNYRNVTVLDVSSAALDVAKARLGAGADSVIWLEADITNTEVPGAYDLWHDRAVFHFLTAAEDRRAYVKAAMRSVKPGGHLIVSTFAEDGPLQCSGLPVMRYSAAQLHAQFADGFLLISHERELHRTPFGTTQQFTYCHCRRHP
jgi:2-polyprenyl-3-methyl-5-hydroxy-6-metoxy-1,4-benzoquinol methylase